MLSLPNPDVYALAGGEVITAFVDRGMLTEGDEVSLVGGGPRVPRDLKPAYQRWAEIDLPPGEWSAVVVSVHPAASVDPAAGAARHILREAGDGDLVLLRVYRGGEPVLSDAAFDARRRSVEGAILG